MFASLFDYGGCDDTEIIVACQLIKLNILCLKQTLVIYPLYYELV